MRVQRLKLKLQVPCNWNGVWDSPGIFLTGALGDVLTVMSFHEIQNVKTVYYAASQFNAISPLMRWLCPLGTKHVNLWEDWSVRKAFYSLEDFCNVVHVPVPKDVIDLSILRVFHSDTQFKACLWEKPVADLTRFRLPEKYVVLCPYARDKLDSRDLTNEEIQAVMDSSPLPVVVLHKGQEQEIPTMFNLQNQTTLFEAIAIMAGASSCVTVDSALSVVAARFLPRNRMLVKSSNPHLINHRHWYYPTHDSFTFITPTIKERLKELSWTD